MGDIIVATQPGGRITLQSRRVLFPPRFLRSGVSHSFWDQLSAEYVNEALRLYHDNDRPQNELRLTGEDESYTAIECDTYQRAE